MPANEKQKELGQPAPSNGPAFSPWWLLSLFLGCSLGIGVGTAILTSTFSKLPTDLQRKSILIQTLTNGPAPSRVLFGSSVTMNGVDGYYLDELLREGITYNVSSTGQSLVESRLLYDLLPPKVRDVTVIVHPIALEESPALFQNTANAFVMSGFQIKNGTGKFLETIVPRRRLDFLFQHPLTAAFQSRWALTGTLNTYVRQTLRKDLKINRAATDLKYPAPYTERFPESAFNTSIHKWTRMKKRPCFDIHPKSLRLIEEFSERAKQDERRILFVSAPVHPRLAAEYGGCFLDNLSMFIEQEQKTSARQWLSLTELLDDEHFLDAVHIGNQGARLVTAEIAKYWLPNR